MLPTASPVTLSNWLNFSWEKKKKKNEGDQEGAV